MNNPTSGYLNLCFHVHQGENIYLRVPTVWDPITNEWRGFIKTPKTNYLIHATGADSAELERNFIKEMGKIFDPDGDDTALATEVFEMFKPKPPKPKARGRRK